MRFVSKRQLAAMANAWLRRFDIVIERPSDIWRVTATLGKQPQPGSPPAHGRSAWLRVFGPQAESARFDFAVVMPTTLRPSIGDALRSVFAQDFAGTVQTLVGIDAVQGDPDALETICRACPANQAVMVFDPGYSTSVRHGGLHPARDGGVLRTVLTYLAASRCVAYLDDDNWWAPGHLSSLHAALQGHEWAWSLRYFVHPVSRQPICEDIWECIGPQRRVKGFVDPNCLAIDKLACEAVLRWWSIPERNSSLAMDADRQVFRILDREFRGETTGQATCYYVLNEADEQHPQRLAHIGAARYAAAGGAGQD